MSKKAEMNNNQRVIYKILKVEAPFPRLAFLVHQLFGLPKMFLVFGPTIIAAAGVKFKDQDEEYPFILVKGRGPSS